MGLASSFTCIVDPTDSTYFTISIHPNWQATTSDDSDDDSEDDDDVW